MRHAGFSLVLLAGPWLGHPNAGAGHSGMPEEMFKRGKHELSAILPLVVRVHMRGRPRGKL